jgi:phosphate transport system permease protein
VFVNGLRMGEILLVGAIALSLLVVPIVIVSSQEALRAVPDGLRDGSLATGATRWQTIRGVVLPAALPGIVTGTILALARAIGETAPLIMVGAVLEARQAPGPTDLFGSMPTMIYYWAFRPITEFHNLAALGILVLLTILLGMYGLAFFVRNHYETRL